MKLLVGLGNIGKDYVFTRHNVGHILVDELNNIKHPKDLVVRKTDVYMNESGSFVKKLVDKHNLDLDNLYIVHDDLDIKLGEYKIQKNRGPKDHNGIADIEEKLGTKDFWRIRVGVDNRPFDNKPMGIEYVLQNFTDDEKIILDKVVKEICKKLETL